MIGSSSGKQQTDEQHVARRGGMAADCSGSSSMHQRDVSLDSEELLLSEAEILLEYGPERALLVLSRDNLVRRAAAAVVTDTCFERFILALIFANCATLAMYSQEPGFHATQLGHALGYADWVFAACFSLEMLLKIIAMGLICQPGTYLRDGWNMLDGAVVVLGWVDIALAGDGYTFLRTVRALRPLRTITHIRGLKVPVATLAKALPMLLDVLVLCLFAFFVFGVVAVQLFAGALRSRCAAADLSSAQLLPAAAGAQQTYANVSYLLPADGSEQQCSGVMAADVTWGLQGGTPVWSGGSPGGGWTCPTQPQQPGAQWGMFCAAFENPNHGMTSFDNILWAWVTIFQCVTTEGWTDIAYQLQDAVSGWVLVYFLVLITFGSFFLVNLALAVLYLQFTKEFSMAPASKATSRAVSMAGGKASSRAVSTGGLNAKQLQQHVQKALNGRYEEGPSSAAGEHHGPHQQQVCRQHHPHSMQERQRQDAGTGIAAGRHNRELLPEPQPVLRPGHHPSHVRQGAHCADDAEQLSAVCPEHLLPNSAAGARVAGDLHAGAGPFTSLPGAADAAAECTESEPDYVTARVIVSRRTSSRKAAHWASMEHVPSEQGAHKPPERWAELSPRTILKPAHPSQQQAQRAGPPPPQPSSSSSCMGGVLQNCWQASLSGWEWLRHMCRELVKSGWVEIASLLVIITNTAVMASQSYPGSPQWQVVSDYLNVAFCLYFTLELLVKLLASSIKAFARDRMNQFDALVVAASLVEVVMFLVPGDETSSSSLSVLRTARLLRVFKLARSWAELNRIITTILRSFSQVMYLSLLLLLFMFVFALMGMQLFGFKFASCSVDGAQQLCPPGTPPQECPVYPDCYVPCQESQASSWINVTGSPYNGMAYCEQFPRSASAAQSPAASLQYWAQVGKAVVPDSRFDNIGWALVTVFQIVTTENWNEVAYNAMKATSPAAFLWFLAIIIMGNYILLNLFLAILLENFGSSSGNGGGSTANSTGGTLAAAAKAAQLTAWLQDIFEASWFAKMTRCRNRVSSSTVQDKEDDGDGSLSPVASGGRQTSQGSAAAALQAQPASGGSSADGATRGPAALPADAGRVKAHSAFERRASAAGGPAAARGRSFSPLVPPSSSSDNLQGLLANRHGSFFGGQAGARTHSVTGLVSRSAQSCTSAVSFAHWKPGDTQEQFTAGQPAQAVPGAAQQGAGRTNAQAAAELAAAVDRGLSSSSSHQPPGVTPRCQLSGRSCWLFGPDNWLRQQLHRVLRHPLFEHTVLVFIMLSSIALALDMPHLDPSGAFKRALEVLDCIFAVLFLVEAVLKVVVHGFVFNGPGSYLRSPWNLLDFAIVVIGMVVMGTTLSGLYHESSLSSLKALQTLRALRPLRVASRLQGMKVVINSLFASLPALGNVLLVCLLFYLIFGIMAVDLLGGAMYSCQATDGSLFDADYVLPAGEQISRDWCVNSTLQVTTSAYHSSINVTFLPYTPQREWTKPIANYDNILMATFTLWQISTTELWVNTMFAAIAAVGPDQQPRPGHNPALALFFIVFIIFGGFFVLQLFVSVTIEKFSEMHQQQGKCVLLTPQQEGWLRIERLMADINLKVTCLPPKQRWRAAVFRVVQSVQFEVVTMAAIIANCLVMAMTHADMSTTWQDFMTWAITAFTIFFTLEILAKFVALGFKAVLRDAWCRFDIVVVAVSILGVGMDLGTPSDLQFLPLLRVLRVVRIFRLVQKAEGLRVLLCTLMLSLPALGNIVSVLGLFFFIYSVVGMNLWGLVKPGQYLTRHANFQHVGMALLTLFRMITGESWNGIMQDCMVTNMCVQVIEDLPLPTGGSITAGTWLDPSDGVLSQLPAAAVVSRCSPSPAGAVIFFCSFVLLCGLVLVNFVIGVIIDNFASSSDDAGLPVNKDTVDEFAQVWSRLDPQASCFIPAIQLTTLIQELRPPMGVKGEVDARAKTQGIIMNVDIPLRKGKIHFLETMHALAGRLAGCEVPEEEEQKVRQQLYPRLPTKEGAADPKYSVSHFYAALAVQAGMRGFLKRHALKEGSRGERPSSAQPRRRRSTLEWLQQSFRTTFSGSSSRSSSTKGALVAAAAAAVQNAS